MQLYLRIVIALMALAGSSPALGAHPASPCPTLDWQEAGGHDLVFSHTDSVYWVRLHLTNSSEKRDSGT